MQTYLDCIPCFLRQALDAARMVTPDAAIHAHVLRETLRMASEMPFDKSPPWMGQKIHQLLREATGEPDPYRQAKQWANDLALALRPELEQRVRESVDPFATSVLLAIAGNVIDLGCRSQVSEQDVLRSIEQALCEPFEGDALEELRAAALSAGSILYLADNAGEIVLDRILIEQLPLERVMLAVRGYPVINDATREDAAAAGLTELVNVIDNGSDVPGTILESCSDSFRDAFARADVVIAKGQGNYETLSGVDGDVFFLFKAKCPVVAREMGCALGQIVVCRAERECGARHASRETPEGWRTVTKSGAD
jgi:uncharacterized protein with ATP-grasp and redox domains